MKIIIASSKSQHKGDIASSDLNSREDLFNCREITSQIKTHFESSIVETLAPAFLRYNGVIMKSFLNKTNDPTIINFAKEMILFSSPYYGLVSFNEPIFEYKLAYTDKINGKSIISLWKDSFHNFSPKEVIIDLSTKQQSLLFKSPHTIRYDFAGNYLKSAHHGKVLKGGFLYTLLLEMLDKGEISEEFNDKHSDFFTVFISY
jgi:cytoplasmic iron level regulating protein YaaA (DUF328/UPF0246 family)